MFEPTPIPLSAIWPPLIPAHPDQVQRFADRMRDGESFPPIRVVAGLPGQYRVIDGTHRAAAATAAGLTHIDGIVCTPEFFAS